MSKLVDVLLFIWDIALSLIFYPVFYMVDIAYLLYANIRYDVELKEGFIGINKKYVYYITNGLKIHKERILGV